MVDPQTVKKAQNGDHKAFKELYDSTSLGIYNLMLRMSGNKETAEDLTQEVYLRVWRSLGRLKSPKAFVTWLHRIAMNVYRDWSKSASHRLEEMRVGMQVQGQDDDPENDEGLDLIPSPHPLPDEETLRGEMKDVIERAISSLPEKYRAVVIMHHIEGLGLKEIAKSLDVAQGTVMSRLARARAMLRERLSGYIEGD
ncbi:sigma-70 family RNA polymerase sigma factor [Candidatus Poribacteria bacterium]|nr:sigma-70 family RNA polymerase sigma factor [Candidatus Poribacteria bacterium]